MSFQIHEELFLRYPREEVFRFFSQAENLNLLTPPWLGFSVVSSAPIEMAVGTVIQYRLKLRGMPISWESEITEWRPPFSFCDVQRRGPYRCWVHRHSFEAVPGGTVVTDHVDYEVIGGALVNRLLVAGDLKKIFAYRKARLLELFP
ncbi:MAG: SRPBCC family protein [Actinomycetia bacterium]|nr:SRPBCC family protein [Actinomycetes bacterium]